MLLVILNILKIIGITLLVILGIILLILLIVLFVPIRYRLDASVPETDLDQGIDTEKIYVSARFHWLLHAVRGGIEFPDKKEFTLKVLWLTILPSKSDKKSKKKEENKNGSADKDSSGDAPVTESGPKEEKNEDIKEEKDTDNKEQASKTEDNSENTENAESEVTGEKKGENTEVPDTEEKEDKNLIEIISDISDKIEEILKMPQNVLEKIQYTISRVCDKIGMIKRTIENDIFKRAFELVKKKLIKLIKMILPDKCDISVLFGTGDPADTATIMAAYSAFYPILYNKVRYQPDFERKVIMADAHLKGHITVFTVLYCVLRCYLDKDVKRVIKRFKKIINS